jgi:hypothetical protein
MVQTCHPRIDRALEIVDRETDFAASERRAFERFRSRLTDEKPDLPRAQTDTGAGGATALVTGVTASPGNASLRNVRAAYRETVMAVPHFESEYGGGLAENLAAEFGPDLAAQVADGQRLTPVLYDALLAASEACREERAAYERTLDEERESLRDVRRGLADCEARASELGDTVAAADDSRALAALDDRLAALEREVADLAAARQDLVHGRTARKLSGVSGESLTSFLYDNCEETCPALAAVASTTETIRSLRRECLH